MRHPIITTSIVVFAVIFSLAGCASSNDDTNLNLAPGTVIAMPGEWPADIPRPDGEIVAAPNRSVNCFQPEGTSWVCSINVKGDEAALVAYGSALVAEGFQELDALRSYTKGTSSVSVELLSEGYIAVDASFDK